MGINFPFWIGENHDSYAIGHRSPLQRKIDNIDPRNETGSTSSFSINRPLRGHFRRRLETGGGEGKLARGEISLITRTQSCVLPSSLLLTRLPRHVDDNTYSGWIRVQMHICIRGASGETSGTSKGRSASVSDLLKRKSLRPTSLHSIPSFHLPAVSAFVSPVASV